MADRRALIVANDSYDNEGLRRLSAPAHDAEALQAVLANPQIGRFDVKVLYNNPSHVIRLEVERFFADSKPDDLLLLHFSCHGLKDASGELYLAATDTQPTLLKATAVPAQFVNQVVVDSRARRIVLFLDCCYGGAFSRGAVARAAGGINVEDSFPLTHLDSPQADNGRGKVVISASHAHEPDTVYVVPITSDSEHYPLDGKLRVYRSRTGGNEWEVLTKGLPRRDCYVKRTDELRLHRISMSPVPINSPAFAVRPVRSVTVPGKCHLARNWWR